MCSINTLFFLPLSHLWYFSCVLILLSRSVIFRVYELIFSHFTNFVKETVLMSSGFGFTFQTVWLTISMMLWIFNLLMILTWIQLLHFVNLTPLLPEGFVFYLLSSLLTITNICTRICVKEVSRGFPCPGSYSWQKTTHWEQTGEKYFNVVQLNCFRCNNSIVL